VPIRCQKNSVFVINVESLENPKDLLADDNGSYKNNGTTYTFVTTSGVPKDEDDIHVESLKRSKLTLDRQLKQNEYIIAKTFYTNSSFKHFTRKIYEVYTCEGISTFKILQYRFEGPERDFQVNIHKNSKKNFTSYARKSEKIKLQTATSVQGNAKGPSKIHDELFEEGVATKVLALCQVSAT